MHANSKFRLIKMFLFFFVFVTFCGSIFFVLYNNNLNKGNNVKLTEQDENITTQEASSSVLLGDDNTAEAADGDDVAEAGFEASFYIKASHCSISVKWEMNYADWDIGIGAIDQDPETGSTTVSFSNEETKTIKYYDKTGMWTGSFRNWKITFTSVTVDAGYYCTNYNDLPTSQTEYGNNPTIELNTAVRTYYVGFDNNGGSGSISQMGPYTGNFTINLPYGDAFSRVNNTENFTFAGWSKSRNTTPSYRGGEQYSAPSTSGSNTVDATYYITFYVYWLPTITLNDNITDDPVYVGTLASQTYDIYMQQGASYYTDVGMTNSLSCSYINERKEQRPYLLGMQREATVWDVEWQLNTLPVHPGYLSDAFTGYYDANDNQVINAQGKWVDGERVRFGILSDNVAAGNLFPNGARLYAKYDNNKKASFTLTINPNGGSVNTTQYTGVYRSTVSPIEQPIRTGYTFAGWQKGAGQLGYINSYISFTMGAGNTTLTAQWEPNTYSFNLNNESATAAGTPVVYYKFESAHFYADVGCVSEITSIAIPTKTNFTFGGYYTQQNGAGTVYINNNGNFVNNPQNVVGELISSSTQLYAYWKPTWNLYAAYNTAQSLTEYTLGAVGGLVSAGNNGANFSTTYTYVEDNVNLTSRSCYANAATGYQFVGWYTSLNGGTRVSTDNPANLTNATYYARFNVLSYDVTINWNRPTTNSYGNIVASGQNDGAATTTATSYLQKYYYGANVTLTVTENLNYGHFTKLTQGGVVVSTNKTYSFVMPAGVVNYVGNFIPVWHTNVISVAMDQIYTGDEFTPSNLNSSVIVTDKINNDLVINSANYEIISINQDPNSPNNWNVGANNTATIKYLGSSDVYYLQNSLITVPFAIIPREIKDNTDGFTFTLQSNIMYTGSPLRPKLIVAEYNGHNMIEVTDYVLSYTNNVNAGNNTGHYTITGTGNYRGSVNRDFTIERASLSFVVANVTKTYTYTHNSISPTSFESSLNAGNVKDITITYDGNGLYNSNNLKYLQKGTDFVITEITGQNYIDAGVKYFKVTGIGNYKDDMNVAFTIVPKNIANNQDAADCTLATDTVVYNGIAPLTDANGVYQLYNNTAGQVVYRGESFVPTFGNITLTYTYQNISFSTGNYALIGGTDYTITAVTNNLNIGTAIVLIEGTGNFEGSRTLNFEIRKKSVAVFSLVDASTEYNNAEQRPTLNDDGLISFVYQNIGNAGYSSLPTNVNNYTNYDNYVQASGDYVIVYYGRKNPSEKGHWENGKNSFSGVEFKNVDDYDIYIYATKDGNYEGAQLLTYTITARDSDNLVLTLSKTVTTYNADFQMPTITLTYNGTNNVVLDSDYSISTNGDLVNSISAIDSTKLYWKNAGTVTIVVTPSSNYVGNNPTATFTINQLSINNAQITAPIGATYVYNGRQWGTQNAITFTSVIVNGIVLQYSLDVELRDYNILVADGANIDAGNASAVLKGRGNFTGECTYNFVIDQKEIALAGVLLNPDSVVYNGLRQVVNIDATDAESGIFSFEDDSTIIYTRNGIDYIDINAVNFTDAGVITITVQGKHNYKNSVVLTYTINQAHILGFSYTYTDGTTTATTPAQNATPIYSGSAYYITKVFVLVQDVDQPIEYNVPSQSFTNAFNFTYSQLAAGGTVTGDAVNFTDAYAEPITITLVSRSGNYVQDNITGTLDILPAAITTVESALLPISNYAYTGSAVIPTLQFSTSIIVAADYYLTFPNNNNTNAGTVNVRVNATLNRNFTGYFDTTFVIDPKSINGADIFTVLSEYEYNGQQQKPNITHIALDDRNLYAQDLNVVYTRTDNVKPASDFIQVGNFSLTITHKDAANYSGSVSATYRIVPKQLTLNNIVWPQDVIYNAFRQEPTITVEDNTGGNNIIHASDYEFEFVRSGYSTHQVEDLNINFTNAGSITIYITTTTASNYYIKDNLNNNAQHYMHVYTIAQKDLSQAIVEFETMIYNGAEQTPTFTVTDNDIIIESQHYILRYEQSYKDYTYVIDSRSELVNAHQNGGYITITGTGNFTGTKEVTFSIERKPISDLTISVVINPYAHTGNPIVPSGDNVVVTDNYRNEVLISPDEFTLAIAPGQNNVSVGEVQVLLTGFGNYTGTRDESFFIIEVHINGQNTMQINLRENEFTFDNTIHKPYVQSIIIHLSTGDNLIYVPQAEEIQFIYTGADTLTTEQMYVYSGNYAVKFVPVNGNYVIDSGYENTYNEPYVINKKTITADMFTISNATQTVYNGTSQKATVSASYNGVPMTVGTDYTLAYYRGVTQISADNDFVNAGTISLYINSNAARNFMGTLDSLSYVIAPKSITGVMISRQSLADLFYTGSKIAPEVDVKDTQIIIEGNPKVLVKYDPSLNNGATADYSVNYVDAVNASTDAKVVITGMNNYDSATTATLTFEIKKALLNTIVLANNSAMFNRTEQTINVNSITTNTVAVPSLTNDIDYTYYRDGVLTTDLTNAGLVVVRASAKSTSQNFAGYAEENFTISPAVINVVNLATSSVVYNTEPQTNKIYTTTTVGGNTVQQILGSITTQNNLSLQPGEYTITLSHDNPLDTGNCTVPGNVSVTVNTANNNFTGNANTTFVINKKTLNDATTIKVYFYYVDASGNPVDASGNPVVNKVYVDSQYYEGKTVKPEVRYYFTGDLSGNFATLDETSQYTYTAVPSDWRMANNITITITANTNGFYVDSVECIFQVKPLPWNHTHIQITIQPQIYTGQPIVFTSANASAIEAKDVRNNDPLYFGTHFEVYTEDPVTHEPYTDDAGNEYVGGYLNNLNAGSAFVLFKSSDPNYGSGFVLVEFEIQPRSITENSFEFGFDSLSYVYDREEHKPQVTTSVYHGDGYDITLNNNGTTDYTLSWIDTNGDPVLPVNAGDYKVVLTGTGNFKDSVEYDFRINKKDISQLNVSFVNNNAVFKENTSQKPQTVVYYETNPTLQTGFNLVEGDDYTISYQYANFIDNVYYAITSASANFVNAGNYKLIISASGANYINSAEATFVIDRDILTGIVLSANSVIYNKTAQTPSITIQAQNNTAVTLVNLSYQQKDGENFVNTNSPDYTNAGTVRVIANATNNINYTGVVQADFVIEPKEITRSMITLTANFTYNKQAQEAAVVIEDDGDVLIRNTDYILNYNNNINASSNAEAIIVGKGNYTMGNPNILTLYYTIAPLNINSITFTQSAIQNKVYNGSSITLQQQDLNGVLVHDGYNLILDTDFEIEYANNTRKDANTYNITIKGTNNYTGNKQTTFVIDPLSLYNNPNIEINLAQTEFTYTGEEIKPVPTSIINNLISTEEYIDPTNYTISWADNVDVMWNGDTQNPAEVRAARIIVSGHNNYKDSKVFYFKILALDINSPLVVKNPSNIPVQKYKQGRPCTPQPVLTFNNQEVQVTYSYTNNTFANANATVTIRAVANTNFKGSFTLTFEIDINNIKSVTVLNIQDVVYNGTVQKLVPLIKDEEVTLTEYNTTNPTGQYSLEYQSERFGSNPDFTNVDTITIIITGVNGYKDSLTMSYKILPITFTQDDITNQNLLVSGVQSFVYNGKAREQTKENINLTVAENNLTIPQNCYKIDYLNNINAGDAVMHFTFYAILEGTAQPNNFAGSFDYTFVINKLALSASMFSQSVSSSGYEYNGQPRTLDLLLVLSNDLSFTAETGKFSVVRYENNTNVTRDILGNVVENQAKAIVEADQDSNFSGSVEVLFTITPKTAEVNYYDATLSLSLEDIIYNGTQYMPTFTRLQDVLYGGDLEAEVDYRIKEYKNNINASVAENAKVVVEFIKNYDGEIEIEFTILQRNISDVVITPATLQNYVFDGTAHKQEITLTYTTADNEELTLGTDSFAITYSRSDGVSEENKYVYAGDIQILIESISTGNFTGSTTLTYTIAKVNILDLQYKLSSNTQDFVYTGNQLKPGITLCYGDYEDFRLDVDYSLDWGENINVVYDANNQPANSGTIIITSLSGNIYGNLTVEFTILPRDLSSVATITLSTNSMVYTGSALMPTVEVFDNGLSRALILTQEYTITNTDNILPGTVTISAQGKGNFAGIISAEFIIVHRTFNQDSGLDFAWVDDISNIVYNHAKHEPNFSATYVHEDISALLEANVDYSYDFKFNKDVSTNTQKATLTITGINGYEGSYIATFEIKAYNIQNLLEGKKLSPRKYDGTSKQEIVYAQLASFMVYLDESLVKDTDYTVDMVRTSGEVVAGEEYIDIGSFSLTITGVGNYTGTVVLTFNIVSKEIDNIILVIDGAQYYNSAQLEYRGYAYTLGIIARATLEEVAESAYMVEYFNANDEEIQPTQLELLNAGTIKVKVTGINNFMGECVSEIVILPKNLTDDDIEIANFAEHVNYYYGVEREQANMMLYFNTQNNTRLLLEPGVDYEVKYYNNSYAGRALMQIVGKGNYNQYERLSRTFIIDKILSVVNPSISNTTYFEGDWLPTISLLPSDTNGVIMWDTPTHLTLGTNEYSWTFIPTDSSNYEKVSGKLSITAIAVVPIDLIFDGNYKTQYYVYDYFNASGLIVYLLYNNGKQELLDESMYTLTIASGQELYINSVPSVVYNDGTNTITRALQVEINKIPLTITYSDTEGLVQTEQSQYIKYNVINEINSHKPGLLVRYYSHTLKSYTEGITQGGDYTVSVVLVDESYIIQSGESIDIYVKTGVITTKNGLITVIDELGFDDGVTIVMREYDNVSQVKGVLDFNTFNMKKFYEVQLWKGNELYVPKHSVTVRINLGRELLESSQITGYLIPSSLQTAILLDYTVANRDNVEFKTEELGGFIFGEKVEAPNDLWWVFVVAGIVLGIAGAAICALIILKRRKVKALTKSINLKLGK